MTGRNLKHYRLLERVGAGGMGEVYRADDTVLERQVAIKVLPPAFSQDAGRLARFNREARALAALNHPNIAAIYGLETDGETAFLVMELVAGENLAQILEKGPLAIADAIQFACQMAQAVEAAHTKGVVHRDLKPANVMIDLEGKVKILDFGLAKPVAREASWQSDTEQSTLSQLQTRDGVVMGTAAYMSPEQARGRLVDERTDIWAFGCIVYEMLTARRAFGGESLADCLSAVLQRDPDWSAIPAATPERVRDVLQRCLRKDAKRRLHHIADARIELEEAAAEPAGKATPAAVAPRSWKLTVALAAVAAALAFAAGFWLAPRAGRTDEVVALSVQPGGTLPTEFLPSVALSPDGKRLVFVSSKGNRSLLFRRGIDSFDVVALSGTEGAIGPFFSPGGDQVAFFASGKLKKVAFEQGTPITICDAPNGRGGAWGPDGTIVFAATNKGGLSRVPSDGGAPQPLTTLDASKGERSHRLPYFLPDGKSVLFTVEVTGSLFDEARVEAVSLAGKRSPVLKGGYSAQYSPTGHVVYAHSGGLLAAPFDSGKMRTAGSPVAVLDGVLQNPVTGSAQFQLTPAGSIVFEPSGAAVPNGTLVWVDMKGTTRPAVEGEHAYYAPSFSPDGRKLAITIANAGNFDIWILDVERGALSRLTFEAGINSYPIWTPDGRRIVFSSNRAGARNLFWVPADNSAPAQRLTTSPNTQVPGAFTPDGRTLVYEEADPINNWDILALPMGGAGGEVPGTPVPVLQTAFFEGTPRLSPNGKWLAYMSDESGRSEVYVRPFPGPGGKTQISSSGGMQPVWSHDGSKLYYRKDDRMLEVGVGTSPAVKIGAPNLLFAASYAYGPGRANFDVAPDGSRFVMIQGATGPQVSIEAQVNVIVHWAESLKRIMAARKK